MKRSTIVALGTVAGVAGVLGLNPKGPDLTGSTTATTAAETVGTTTSATPAPTTSASATPKATASAKATTPTTAATPAATAAATGTTSATTITGKAYAARNYGNVQLKATVSGGKITAITAVSVPSNDGKSMQISSYSIPVLTKQALAAQSANIQGLSGATFTSNAYAQSLQSILDQMG